MATDHQQLGDELVLQIAAVHIERLGSVRHHGELQVARDGEWLWLKGLRSGQLSLAMRQLPAYASYRLDAEGRLFPLGQLTPTGRLKAMDWEALPSLLPVEMPPSAIPAVIEEDYPIRLLPAPQPKAGTALRCRLSHWKAFGETAAKARLDSLRFALSEEGEVLIMGEPLPPIPGKEYWLRGQLLLPAGFDLEFPIIAELIHNDPNSLLLFDEQGQYQALPLKAFIAATRSGIRLSTCDE